jgi:multidrug transporter EmrE-like cation transporter
MRTLTKIHDPHLWRNLIFTVGVAVLANSVAAIWATQSNLWTTPWFLALLILSPIVFITFGVSVSNLGVAIGSATIDSLLTLSTILVGLFAFGEVGHLSQTQFFGLCMIIIGIVLMQKKK